MSAPVWVQAQQSPSIQSRAVLTAGYSAPVTSTGGIHA
jgi:hypothetical protein